MDEDKLAKHHGITIENVPGDGYCLYHAFLKATQQHIKFHSLRDMVHEEMIRNPDYYNNFDEIRKISLKVYISDRKKNKYAGTPEVWALSRLFSQTIVIIQSINGKIFDLAEIVGFPTSDKVVILILRTNGIPLSPFNHYLSGGMNYLENLSSSMQFFCETVFISHDLRPKAKEKIEVLNRPISPITKSPKDQFCQEIESEPSLKRRYSSELSVEAKSSTAQIEEHLKKIHSSITRMENVFKYAIIATANYITSESSESSRLLSKKEIPTSDDHGWDGIEITTNDDSVIDVHSSHGHSDSKIMSTRLCSTKFQSETESKRPKDDINIDLIRNSMEEKVKGTLGHIETTRKGLAEYLRKQLNFRMRFSYEGAKGRFDVNAKERRQLPKPISISGSVLCTQCRDCKYRIKLTAKVLYSNGDGEYKVGESKNNHDPQCCIDMNCIEEKEDISLCLRTAKIKSLIQEQVQTKKLDQCVEEIEAELKTTLSYEHKKRVSRLYNDSFKAYHDDEREEMERTISILNKTETMHTFVLYNEDNFLKSLLCICVQFERMIDDNLLPVLFVDGTYSTIRSGQILYPLTTVAPTGNNLLIGFIICNSKGERKEELRAALLGIDILCRKRKRFNSVITDESPTLTDLFEERTDHPFLCSFHLSRRPSLSKQEKLVMKELMFSCVTLKDTIRLLARKYPHKSEEKWTETLQQSSKKKKSLAISNLEDLIAAKGTKFLGCFRAKVFTAGQTASSRAETSNSAIKKEIIKKFGANRATLSRTVELLLDIASKWWRKTCDNIINDVKKGKDFHEQIPSQYMGKILAEECHDVKTHCVGMPCCHRRAMSGEAKTFFSTNHNFQFVCKTLGRNEMLKRYDMYDDDIMEDTKSCQFISIKETATTTIEDRSDKILRRELSEDIISDVLESKIDLLSLSRQLVTEKALKKELEEEGDVDQGTKIIQGAIESLARS
ncbi:hypothetical protein ADUPG1_010109, partial [Aduncisulcus paluster]